MEKCLFITSQFPYPLDNGGKIGAVNGIKIIKKFFDVTVLSFSEEPEYVDEGISFLSTELENVVFEPPVNHAIHIRKNPCKLMKAMLAGYIKCMPYIVSKYQKNEMYSLIDKAFNTEIFWDLIFIDYLNMEPYGDYITKNYLNRFKYIVLKDHNIEYEIIKQASENSSFIKKAVLELEWRRTRRYEINAIKKYKCVFSVCDSNCNFMSKYNSKSYTMLPAYNSNSKSYEICNEHNILYMGNLSWDANMTGLEWFVKDVFPIIRCQVPDAKLTIVGSGPASNPFKGIDGITYLGYVKDIDKVYENEAVFIVPLFEGSGIRIKILDAFNNMIPVVSTTIGCGTISANNGEEILIADRSKEFAERVVELLIDHKKNEMIARNAKDFLNREFSEEAIQCKFAKDLIEAFPDCNIED